MVVGARHDDVGSNSNQGSAYIFERNQGGADNWGEVANLTAADGAAEDWFGWSVSIDINTIIVGAYYDDVGANNNQGSAYTFVRHGNEWIEESHPTASDVEVDDFFGGSVSISGDTIVVGAYGDDVSVNINQGSAYVFERKQGGADNWGMVTNFTA